MDKEKIIFFFNRILRAINLNLDLYEEVEEDKTALTEAILVVILASLAAGVGLSGMPSKIGFLLGIGMDLFGWLVAVTIIYWLGGLLIPEKDTRVDLGQLLRTVGFAASPGILRVFGLIPSLTGPIFMVASVWMLVALVIAVRQALDYRGLVRAFLVALAGWLGQNILQGILFFFLGNWSL